MSRKMRGSSWSDEPNAPSTSYHRPIPPPPPPSLPTSAHRGNNVFKLLARREICPKSRHVSRKLWGEGSVDLKSDVGGDAKAGLISWVEAESFMHLAAKYCPLSPAPRSTIAAAFSPDGRTLASTHGDHTVKIIDCQTGKCIKVLNGHRRTPWVVRFHPICPEILASGSLDHEVRLWDANTANCIGSRDFYRPIASIAFHAHGELLAVASGHKLYIWLYSKRGETSSPAIVLKTRRSLRAVHFHPHGAPFLLTAEVNDLDSSDSSMTLATSLGYLRYPPPTVFLADAHSNDHSNSGDDRSLIPLPFLMWPSFSRDAGRQSAQQTDGEASNTPHRPDPSSSVCLLTYSTPSGQYELLLSPIEPTCSSPAREEPRTDAFMSDVRPPLSTTDSVRTSEVQFRGRSNHIFPLGDQMNWELPFLQGWLVGQSQAGQQNMVSASSSVYENFSASGNVGNRANSSPVPNSSGQSRVVGRSGFHYRSSRSQTSAAGSGEAASLSNTAHLENDAQPVGGIQPEFTNSLAATAAAELPCTVKLRIWSHDVKNPCTPLDADQCRLTIPHAVLCSEMGAHFSPCGRFLAACVACVMPHLEADPGLLGQIQHDNAGTGTSPTRHPISAHQVMYELRIYSLEESTFGSVLASRAIRAAHCLTSIQFSPTSEHLLLAYGRRHSSLLKSIVIERETSVPIYTILEVYRVSDMELVRVISSAEDEVNVASFHPSVGGGLVYGTKEGMLRILQFDVSESMTNATSSFMDENMLEVPTYALEC